MKTIYVCYKWKKNTEIPAEAKRYCFNCNFDVKVGDTINSPNYTSLLHVMEILPEPFLFFNKHDSELSNTKYNDAWLAIKNLEGEVV